MPVTQVHQEAEVSTPSRKLLVTVEEAAELLSLSRTRIYGLLGCRRIISVKVGGVRRIPMKALQQFVDALCEVEAGEVGR
jgi:excisionase family DNA binding protein